MFFYTDTADAPWTIVKSSDKKRARINCMKHVLASLPYPDKRKRIARGPDPLIVGTTHHVVGNSDHILGQSLHDRAPSTSGAAANGAAEVPPPA